MLRTVWRNTIWYRDAIPPLERKYAAPLKRVVFPVYDVAVICLGLFGLLVGFQAIDAALPSPGPTILYTVIFLAGVLCLNGCAFPVLWTVEIAGKTIILITMMVLLLAMLTAAWTIPEHTGLMLTPLIVVMMLIPILRLWILGVEIAGRRAERWR